MPISRNVSGRFEWRDTSERRGASFGPWTGPLVAPLSTRSLIDDDVLLAPVFRVDIPDPSERKDPLTGERYSAGWRGLVGGRSRTDHESAHAGHRRAQVAGAVRCPSERRRIRWRNSRRPSCRPLPSTMPARLADAFRRAARSRPGMEGGIMDQPRESRGASGDSRDRHPTEAQTARETLAGRAKACGSVPTRKQDTLPRIRFNSGLRHHPTGRASRGDIQPLGRCRLRGVASPPRCSV